MQSGGAGIQQRLASRAWSNLGLDSLPSWFWHLGNLLSSDGGNRLLPVLITRTLKSVGNCSRIQLSLGDVLSANSYSISSTFRRNFPLIWASRWVISTGIRERGRHVCARSAWGRTCDPQWKLSESCRVRGGLNLVAVARLVAPHQ